MIAMGTDSGTGTGRWQGFFEHVEMELMVKAGMTPLQTLQAATVNAAGGSPSCGFVDRDLVALGEGLSLVKSCERAIGFFEDALEADPNSLPARYNLGLAYRQARELCREATRKVEQE